MNEKHIVALLPAYVAGTLDHPEARFVRRHLETCASCRNELAGWKMVRDATRAEASRVPAPGPVLEQALARIEAEEQLPAASLASRLSLAAQLLRGQMPLVRREIWIASPLTMAFGCLVALMSAGPTAAGLTLALYAPIIVAVGVALLYGPENDPSLEIALSSPTSPRLVLLARLTLVYGYDLVLALGATAVVAVALGGPGLLWPLISFWIGPMLFLSALALLLSLYLGPTPAILATMALWSTKLLKDYIGWSTIGTEFVEALWRTNSVLLPLAALMIFLALLEAPQRERLA